MSETHLIEWDRIKAEIARCSDISFMGKMNYSIEVIQKWAKQSRQSLETQNEIAEYRLRLNRKQGEWIEANIPKEGNKFTVNQNVNRDTPTLIQAGIDYHDSPKFRLFARMPKENFETYIAESKEKGQEITSTGLRRVALKSGLPKRGTPLLPTDKFRVIYADPPWRYSNVMPEYFREQADHYPTMTVEDICNLPIKDNAQDNAVLFLWATSPILEDVFKVINAWGFNYKSSFIWDKVKHNMGHYNSVRHEFLLIATRGSCPPDNKKLFDSVQTIERQGHSRKPDMFREIIESLYLTGNKLHLFARENYKGWVNYGNELP